MNDFKDLKPLGCKKIPQELPKLKPEDLTPVSGHEKPKVDLEISNGYKIDLIKNWYKDLILSGNIPKTPTGLIIIAVLGFLMYWLLS